MSKLENLVLMKTTEDKHKTSCECSKQQFTANQKCILRGVLDESILGPVQCIFSIMTWITGLSKHLKCSLIKPKSLHITECLNRISNELK